MKKTICLVTTWYPTKENPYAGLFFKEQAFALSEQYDFIVLHYREHLKKGFQKRNVAKIVNKEKNTVEYDVDVYVPASLYGYDLAYNFKVCRSSKRIDGVGRYVSERRSRFTREAITRVFEEQIKKIQCIII